MKRALVLCLFVCAASSLYGSASQAGGQWELFSNTWVATDALGRELPGHAQCGPMRKDKYIGIFYWTWHTQHGGQGPFDNTKIIAANPDDPQWGPLTAPHHWGEPELGYYISTDPYVIRKHASMLSDADADVIIFDTTNPPFTFKKSYMALCEEYRKIRSEGNRTPQIAFLCPFWDPSVVIKTLYDDFYSKGTFKELWFQWKGKPLIMADPDKIADPEIKKFFTFRKPIPSYFTGPSAPGQWGWLEVYPQHAFRDEKNRIEQVTVGVAQNAVGSELSAMSHRDGAMGRSWHKGARDMSANAVAYGHNFAEQWSHALELDPEFVFITGWNEWVAGHFDKWYKYTGKDSYYPDAIFVDQYDHEYSRDVEPMKGGHMDSYYYQMVGSIRRFKGVPKAAAPSGSKAITIDGHFSDWKDVLPEYRDTIGDTARRDHKGYGETRYVDNSGRNDFVVSKVAYDETNIYFYVKTRDNITPHSDKNWMLLFIDSDHNHATGWEGYDYVVNSHVTDSDETSLKKISEGKWLTVAHPAYRVNGKEMEIQISRSAVTQDVSNGIAFDFHWADNIQKHDIIEFAVSGDSAPNRRFSYRYESTGGNPD